MQEFLVVGWVERQRNPTSKYKIWLKSRYCHKRKQYRATPEIASFHSVPVAMTYSNKVGFIQGMRSWVVPQHCHERK